MDLDDALAESSDPVLSIPVENDIADVEICLEPRTFELIDVTGEFQRAQQELIPYVLDRDNNIEFLGQGQEFADMLLRAFVGVAVSDVFVKIGRNEQDRVGAQRFCASQCCFHALKPLFDHLGIWVGKGCSPAAIDN